MCAGNELACTARSTSIVARATRTRVITPRGKGDGFSGRILLLTAGHRGFATAFQSTFFEANRKKPAPDFRPRFRLTGISPWISAANDRIAAGCVTRTSSCSCWFLVSRSARRERFRFFFRSRNRRARTFLAMTTAMENLATGVGPVKRERTEIVPVNNQGTSLPRKKFFRARAHCNPLSDSTFPVCVPSRRPSEPPPPPSNARVLPRRTRGHGGRALPRHLRTRARVARCDFL